MRAVAIGSLIALTLGVTATFLWSERGASDSSPPSISAIGALRERADSGDAAKDVRAVSTMNRH